MGEPLQLYTLGGVEVHRDHNLVNSFVSRKAHALLIYLTIENRPTPREVLASLLWEDRPNSRALGNLRVVLSSLNRQLRPFLEISRYTIGITDADDIWVDAQALLKCCTQLDASSALKLYRGDFLDGFHLRDCRKFEQWTIFERERLRNILIQTLQKSIQSCIDSEYLEEALTHSEHLLRLNPLMESTHRAVMRVLFRMDRRVEALQHYEQYCTLLRKELNVKPGKETQRLRQRILNPLLN